MHFILFFNVNFFVPLIIAQIKPTICKQIQVKILYNFLFFYVQRLDLDKDLESKSMESLPLSIFFVGDKFFFFLLKTNL